MSRLEVPLERISAAFEGVVPAPIATVSADGVPNSTYVSIIWYVDEERIALSNQFLGKTVDNLRENPYAAIRVMDPTTMIEYEMDATWLRSETSGETFETVRAQLEAVAAQSGMTGTFRLRTVEVLRVDRCAPASPDPVTTMPNVTADSLSSLEVFIDRLADCRDAAEVHRVALQSLDDLFGLRQSVLLLADEASADELVVVAVNGHRDDLTLQRVRPDEGIIGVAAHRRRQIRVGHLDRLVLGGGVPNGPGPSPTAAGALGSPEAQSVVATPLMHGGRVLGILHLDSDVPGHFDEDTGRLVRVIAGHLAMTLVAHAGSGEEPAPATFDGIDPSRATVAFYEHDGTLLVDGSYVIKGVPGRILAAMLDEHARSGRTEFTNRELRLDRTIELPVGNDNLESRLLTLRRRLADGDQPFRLERIGRGRLRLDLDGPVRLVRHGDGPA